MPLTVLVTGASSGIGAAAARLLASSGLRVIGASRHPEQAGQQLPEITWVRMDVTDAASVQRAVDEASGEGAALDALVCCAGYGVYGSVEETDIERARAQFETNYFGTLLPIQAVLPAMRARKQGRIVIVGSLSGRAPIPFQSHYSASKAAVDNLALNLFNELHPCNISVSLVEPGDIDTEFNDRMDWGTSADSAYGDRIRRCEEVIRVSLPRAPGPDCVARVILRALKANRPHVRYAVGPDSWLIPIGRRLLPDRLSLALIRRHFRI